MPGDSTDDNSDETDEVDVDVLRSLCEESRAVLDHELEKLHAIDDKALWSVRTAIIILGLLISALSLTDTTALTEIPDYIVAIGGAGAFFLIAAIWIGFATYHMSVEEYGIGPEARTTALNEATERPDEFGEREWLWMLLEGYERWNRNQTAFNGTNTRYLLYTHLLLGIGVTLVVVAGGLWLFGL